jgi:hypothetical protein
MCDPLPPWNICCVTPSRLHLCCVLHPAVREALAIVSEEGLDSLWARHLAAHNQLWEGLTSLGLKPFVEKEQDRCEGQRQRGLNWLKINEGSLGMAGMTSFVYCYRCCILLLIAWTSNA